MKLGIISLGCAKNLVDSELFLGVARRYKIEIVSSIDEADIIAINTCGFIEAAKKEALDTLFEVLDYQKRGKKIIAMGCLVERYLQELKAEIPEIDYFLPLKSYNAVNKLFQELTGASSDYFFSHKDRVLSTPPHLAYLKIAEGCANRCSYCAIPLIRGPYRSRPMGEIIEEAKHLVEKGVKEITVIAQDTTRYGLDLKDVDITDLLRELTMLPKLKMLRILYLYPDEITDGLIELIKNNDKIAKYFDIPLQHCVDKLLKSMNRRGDRAFIERLIHKIRSSIPNAVIRTTMIVGYPGESEQDFLELAQFIQAMRFDRLGVFTYSDEEDTAAFDFTDKVAPALAIKRRAKLMECQQKIAFAFNEKRLGQTELVIIDGYDVKKGAYRARSYREACDDVDGYIYIRSENTLEIGQFYHVLIDENYGYDLGAILKNNKGGIKNV